MSGRLYARLLCSAATISFAAAAGAAAAEEANFNIPPQPLSVALKAFSEQSGAPVLYRPEIAASKISGGAVGSVEVEAALEQILAGSNLSYRREGNTFLIVQAGEGGSSPQDVGAGGDVEALIVTAQKKEENIQDVPIAISAFTQKDLEAQKIEGGFDLLKAIPNVTFSKNNFTSYNFSIRGVGTKAISATTDPGVSVAFNYTGLIQNRLFEQEYFDVERVEVLRGPQGTLYGRNATSGVINVISAKPDLDEFKASLKLEAGNYDARRAVGMINIPVINDMLGIRLAGAMTQRTGYDYNSITENNVNGRDLWSGRVTIGFEPTDSIRADLIWEHFEEDDDRSRTGKQLCRRDPGPDMIGSTPVEDRVWEPSTERRKALFSQGCLPVSLYSDAAFDTPNGLALPFVFALQSLGGDCGPGCTSIFPLGTINGRSATVTRLGDPYGGMRQSRDLRTIASINDPVYRGKADIYELNIDFDITDSLTLSSLTAYNKDEVYSFQDYNRFNTVPVFTDTTLLSPSFSGTPNVFRNLAPGGVFCDPQLGCSDRMAGFDISQAEAEQFSQELRLQSNFDGPVNFSVGANYTEFETLIDYYVFFNLITAMAMTPPFYRPAPGTEFDISICPYSGFMGGFPGFPGNGPVPAGDPTAGCPYVDPNPIESINGEGHNYFRSKNPYSLVSSAAFGELYWNIREDLKLTAGARYTKDEKTFIPVPSQILTSGSLVGGGTVSRGYPELDPIVQEWGEWSGRFGLDWKPDLAITDESLLYAFYSRGYKGGGANPPSPGFASLEYGIQKAMEEFGATREEIIAGLVEPGLLPSLELTGVEYGRTFEPEFVDAFEVGSKNTLLSGAMTFNATAFYYDYKDYQISQIRDRTAVNENFDATIWGLEFETVFAPTRDLRIIANLGYLDTEIADGEESIDIMDRTAGDPNYIVVKPWAQLPSNCVVPVGVAERWLRDNPRLYNPTGICGGAGHAFASDPPIDPATNDIYDYRNYPELNGGAGIRKPLGGNELPNAPHWTTNIGMQYGHDIPAGWRMTVRGDAYWQSQSWARVYNSDPYDKLHGWYNLNVSLNFAHEDWGVEAEIYAKNILDHTPITDAFLNSDDSALTTNVFVLDPRLIGLSVRKTF